MPLRKAQLPDSWTLAKLDEVGAVRLGRARSPAKMTGKFSTPYIRAANISDTGLDLSDTFQMDFTAKERTIYSLKAGDVVLAEASGSASQVGRAAIWRDELPLCCYQNTVIRFRPHALQTEYALILFRYLAVIGEFARLAKGVGIQHLGASRFAGLSIPVPPWPEQSRIANEATRRLSEIDQANESLKAAIERTEQQRREIIAAAAFGHLPYAVDPAPRGRARGTTKGSAAQGSLFDELPATLPARAQRTLPDLPSGWRWVQLEDVGEAKIGKQLSPEETRGPNLRPYLRVANVFEDRIDTSDLKRMRFSDAEFHQYSVRVGDILLNEGQSLELVGRPALIRKKMNVAFQNTLIRFRPSEDVDSEFALLVFRHYLHSGRFRTIAKRSTNIAHLGLRRFAALPFPLPPLPVQRALAAEARTRLDACSSQAAAVQASLNRLPALKQEILAAAVTGKLVKQDRQDEPAVALLARLGPVPEERISQSNREGYTEMSDEAHQASVDDLATVLKDAGKPLRLPDLFRAAGFDRDQTEDIERFYLLLRHQLERTIRVNSKATENVLIEVVPDET